MNKAQPDNLMTVLAHYGTLPDEDIDLGRAALVLAALDHPVVSLDRYHVHLDKLVAAAREYFDAQIAQGREDDISLRIEVLKHVLAEQNEYRGDEETYDDLQNASLIRVIERRKGMPITLSILYLHVARALGWAAHGLNLPGHFIIRLDKGAERVIIDPFQQGAILQAADLRRIVKLFLGPDAELSADYYNPADNREILVRLQNNIKTRLIENEDYEGALKIVDILRVLAPQEYRLLLDEGVLSARTDRPQKAVSALETYIALAPKSQDTHDAVMLLYQIKQNLN